MQSHSINTCRVNTKLIAHTIGKHLAQHVAGLSDCLILWTNSIEAGVAEV